MADEGYPVRVVDAQGRRFGAYRSWAVELAEAEAQEVATLTGAAVTVRDGSGGIIRTVRP